MNEISGRKYAAIVMISTYCLTILGSLLLTVIGKLAVDVFLALLSGLGGLVMYITKAYFDDKDRSLETTKQS